MLEAGLGFAVKPDKGSFIGRDAVLRKKEGGLARRLVQFQLSDPAAMVFHNEGILRDGARVGIVTSGNYGHTLGAGIAMGYVPCAGETAVQVLASRYEIEIAGERVPATPSLTPLYDPTHVRMRA
ncbi:glycine cleavage system aminomethyltransferase T [Rubricella aquisinus]|uniref:Glycine cleavage system aminomethyltransferase T n=1 Tax=Rubricella aquisinus TaxID=2028108 RepID=A0A840WNK4_9RHOB|nr:glycine cleavage system aminomethyltransferase T [Rubricella aquisinus]